MENKNKKRTSKLLLVLNILMLMTLITVPTYAFFWNSRTVDRSPDVVTGEVTEGLVVVVDGALNSNKQLIPSSADFWDEDTEVKKLVYTIIVGLDINEKLQQENLEVSVTTNHDWLKYTVDKSEVGDNVKVRIVFLIKLNAKDWKDSYNDVTHNVNVKLSLVEPSLDPTPDPEV